MTALACLFALGILFIAVEVIVPGGLLGTLGGVLLLGGCALAFQRYGTAGAALALLAASALGALVLFIEFKIVPGTRLGRRAFLRAAITDSAAPLRKEAAALIGQRAQALTMLSPSGYIAVAGQRYEGFCQTGQVPVGTLLEVVGADNFRLIVTPCSLPS